MNKLTISISATVMTSFFAVGTASAGFQGISWDSSISAYGETFLIYADVDAGDQVNAVYGDGSNTLSIGTSLGGLFYQNMFGGPTAADISPALFDFFPSLVYDSWVTIGLEDNVGNNMLNIGIDWAAFEAGGDITTNNGTWFATPDDVQVFEVGGRVLIGQFTVPVSDGVQGVISIQGKNADLSNWNAVSVAFNTIPAPGAFALLGVAGLVARRRRK